MNFLKKIFGKEKIPSNDISSIKQNLSNSLTKLEKLLNEINTTELSKNMNKRLYLVVKGARSQFIVKLQGKLKKINVTDKDDYDSLKKMHSSLVFVIETPSKKDLVHNYYLDLVFRKQMNLIGNQLQLLVNNTNELGKHLSKIKEKRAPIERKKSLETEIPSLEMKGVNLEKKLQKLIKDKKAKQEEISGLRKSLDNTESDTFVKISKLNEEKQEASSRIFVLIAPIKRALKKYGSQGSLEKSTSNLLKKYIDDPVKTACLDNTNQFQVIITDLIKLIESNQLDLKENIEIKVKEVNGHLNDIQLSAKKINKLGEEINSLKQVQGIEENKLAHLREDIKTHETSLLIIDREIKLTEKEITENNEKLGKLKKELKSLS